MGYSIEDFVFWLSVTILGGLVVVMISKALDWFKDLKSNVRENRERIEELERNFEDLLGGRRL